MLQAHCIAQCLATLGPFCTSEKSVHSEKYSVIINALQMPFRTSEKSVHNSDKYSVVINALQMLLQILFKDGLISKGTADNFCCG